MANIDTMIASNAGATNLSADPERNRIRAKIVGCLRRMAEAEAQGRNRDAWEEASKIEAYAVGLRTLAESDVPQP